MGCQARSWADKQGKTGTTMVQIRVICMPGTSARALTYTWTILLLTLPLQTLYSIPAVGARLSAK